MESIFYQLARNFQQMSNLHFFQHFRTGNTIVDTILSSIALTLIGAVINTTSSNTFFQDIFKNWNMMAIRFYMFKKNCVILEGSKTNHISSSDNGYSMSTVGSNRFTAIWDYILENVDTNRDIYQMKEMYSNYSVLYKRYISTNQFMVIQDKHFQIAKDIFAFSTITKEDIDMQGGKKAKIEKITVNIYSYKLSIVELIQFLDDITSTYLLKVQSVRKHQRFIYKLITNTPPSMYPTNYLLCWQETLFESCKTFDNIFFDGKSDILKRIDFFLANKEWYKHKGIPYTLGFGLGGPPGTGKTSFIKALGNYTKRHLIIFSFNLIKTKKQLDQFFFESQYNGNNEYNSISFDKKIIVFEDIDCIGDIVLERKDNDASFLSSSVKLSYNLEKSKKDSEKMDDDMLTLDDILNLWDGIRETPGRMMVITSNRYGDLDKALVRPGRIDVTHEFANASHGTISDIYTYLFEKKIDAEKLSKIQENLFSPAEILNNYFAHKDESLLLEYLMENKKKNQI